MDQIDHIANRVTIAALTGLFFGASLATLRGTHLPKTALSSAFSCALTGTACFGSERLAYHTIGSLVPMIGFIGKGKGGEEANVRREQRLVSHTFGGLMGGAVCGGLFQGRPWGGMVLFTPMMLGVALVENQLDGMRRERIKSLVEGEDPS